MSRLPPISPLPFLHPDPAAKRRQTQPDINKKNVLGGQATRPLRSLASPTRRSVKNREAQARRIRSRIRNGEGVERAKDTGSPRLHDRNGGPTSRRPVWGCGGLLALGVSPARTRPGREAVRSSPCRTVRPDLTPGRGSPASSARGASPPAAAALTCACTSMVVRTGRDAKAADRVPGSRDQRRLMGSRHKTREPDGPRSQADPPPTPLLNFNRRAVNSQLRPQKPIRAGAAVASQSQRPPPPGPRPLSSDSSGAPERENWTSLAPTSGSALPLSSLSPSGARSRLHFRSGFSRPLRASEVRVCGGVGWGRRHACAKAPEQGRGGASAT